MYLYIYLYIDIHYLPVHLPVHLPVYRYALSTCAVHTYLDRFLVQYIYTMS